jgi:hypothetical protein
MISSCVPFTRFHSKEVRQEYPSASRATNSPSTNVPAGITGPWILVVPAGVRPAAGPDIFSSAATLVVASRLSP